ncbi:hypothetical protein R8Z50_17625 [Longispora sp. K20-0274]|uniref:hypothetical protein n=1 Tax=Longispora sp. K20-0274 TaxID=3088255 RepID=UPI00399AA70B
MSTAHRALGRADVDDLPHRPGAEEQRVSAALPALDDHPGRRMLDAAHLEGETLRRWRPTAPLAAHPWEWYGHYRDTPALARTLRARRPGAAELTELTALPTGPAIEPAGPGTPLEHRSITAPAAPIERLTLAGLVARMDAAARAALFTAPCDLRARTRSLAAYQRAVHERTQL